jgi:cytochrome c-type biogenesis protein CcmE
MSISDQQTRGRKASRRLKFIIPTAIVLLVVVWLVASNLQGSSTPYLTVPEVMAAGPSERLVRAVGLARDITWDAPTLTLHFEITHEDQALSVVYKGVRPDMLVDGSQTVVEGKYTAGGIFQATKVLLKCPSKYEERL